VQKQKCVGLHRNNSMHGCPMDKKMISHKHRRHLPKDYNSPNYPSGLGCPSKQQMHVCTITTLCKADPWTGRKRTTGEDLQWTHAHCTQSHSQLLQIRFGDHCAARVIKLMPTAAIATPVPPLLDLVALLAMLVPAFTGVGVVVATITLHGAIPS